MYQLWTMDCGYHYLMQAVSPNVLGPASLDHKIVRKCRPSSIMHQLMIVKLTEESLIETIYSKRSPGPYCHSQSICINTM